MREPVHWSTNVRTNVCGQYLILLYEAIQASLRTHGVFQVHVVEREVILVNTEGSGQIITASCSEGRSLRDRHCVGSITACVGS